MPRDSSVHQAYETNVGADTARRADGEESATLYSRNGSDLAERFRSLKPFLKSIAPKSGDKCGAKQTIIDCELVACDEDGRPDFHQLMELGNRAPGLGLYAFDLLMHNGVNVMTATLEQRSLI